MIFFFWWSSLSDLAKDLFTSNKRDREIAMFYYENNIYIYIKEMLQRATQLLERLRTQKGIDGVYGIYGIYGVYWSDDYFDKLNARYQFRRLPICFDTCIREIGLAESTDDFSNLYDEIRTGKPTCLPSL